jgi:hypothetical protein
VDLSGSLRNLAQPALGALLDLAKATELGGVPGKPCVPGLSEPFGMEIEDEYFVHKHE